MTRLSPRTALLLTLPPLLWAGNAVVGRLVVGSVPPLTMNFLRWVLAALLLLPLGWRVLRAPGELRTRWPYLLLTGTLGVGMYNALQYLALVSSTPINVTLIASSMPVWMLAVGALFYREHPGPKQILGALLSLTGVLFVIARGDPHALLSVRFVRGDLYVIVAIIAWAFYSWLLARPPGAMRGDHKPAWHWAEALLLQVLFGLLGAGAAAALEQAAGTYAIRWDRGWTWAALAYVAVGPAVLAYRCWGLGVATAGPALAAFFSNLTPLFAALMSAAVLGEPPRWYHGAAFVLILAGIAVSGRRG
ncbi:DMT family transporter [Azohydromonas lata]|uniref:DMT family transporter n=1 Tax=Azohydromonas lata TaxID=45677 RepID=UPI0008325EE0|nr:DMT family transporter [Azohydromonas lata]